MKVQYGSIEVGACFLRTGHFYIKYSWNPYKFRKTDLVVPVAKTERKRVREILDGELVTVNCRVAVKYKGRLYYFSEYGFYPLFEYYNTVTKITLGCGKNASTT